LPGILHKIREIYTTNSQ